MKHDFVTSSHHKGFQMFVKNRTSAISGACVEIAFATGQLPIIQPGSGDRKSLECAFRRVAGT
jgi:hypothetical protein